jgi:hypothetical protein
MFSDSSWRRPDESATWDYGATRGRAPGALRLLFYQRNFAVWKTSTLSG